MSCPGAKMSTTAPQFEKEARASEMLLAPTVNTVGSRAGLRVEASTFMFPAAAYGTRSRSVSSCRHLHRECHVGTYDCMHTCSDHLQ